MCYRKNIRVGHLRFIKTGRRAGSFRWERSALAGCWMGGSGMNFQKAVASRTAQASGPGAFVAPDVRRAREDSAAGALRCRSHIRGKKLAEIQRRRTGTVGGPTGMQDVAKGPMPISDEG